MVKLLAELYASENWAVFMERLRTQSLQGGWVHSLSPQQNLRIAKLSKPQGTLTIIEQNPAKSSTWAELARQGHEVWQVMFEATGVKRHYVGVIVKGQLHLYGRKA